MVITDGIHITASTVHELHAFAEKVGLKRCWYHGWKKAHPHYDKPKTMHTSLLLHHGAQLKTTRDVASLAWDAYQYSR